MYIEPAKVHTQVRSRKAKQTVHTAVAQPAAAPLTRPSFGLSLPKLPSSIPASHTVQAGALESCLDLLTFIDAGLVLETDIPEAWNCNDTIFQSVLDRFTAKHSDALSIFDMKVIYSESLDDLITDEEVEKNDLIKICGGNPEQKTINFGIYTNSWEEIFIGKKIEELEKKIPGFGRTVIGLITRATYEKSMYCVTPAETYGMCQMNYWMGEEDESSILEEMIGEMDAEEFEEQSLDVFKKSDLYAHMPEWAVEYGTLMSIEQIQELTTHKDEFVAQVASALLPISEKDKDKDHHSVGISMNHASPALLIRWNDQDATTQIYDDYYRYICESDCTNDIHRFFISNNDPEQLKSLFDALGNYINYTASVEKLLRLVMEV